MKPFLKIWTRLRSLAQKRAVKQEIDDELRFHLEERTAQNVAAGMSPADAARTARRSFGNLQSIREECREIRRTAWLDDFFQDLRFGMRTLWKNPGFTSVAVLSLAVGITVNIIVFSCLNAVLFRSPPALKQPERLVYLHEMDGGIPYGEFEYLRDHNTVFSALSASTECKSGVRMEFDSGSSDHPQISRSRQVDYPNVRFVSGNYFLTVGTEFSQGRGFLSEEDRTPGTHPVIVLSHLFWKHRFNSDPKVLGKAVSLNNFSYTIVGVAPENIPHEPGVFATPDVWVPCMMQGRLDPGLFALRPHDGSPRGVHFYGRLRPGATFAQAKVDLDHLDNLFVKEYFDPKTRRLPWAPYLQKGFAFFPWIPAMAALFTLIMLIVGSVLLIACANVASLLLARATARQLEMSIRLALGASRSRLIRQLLAESLLIAGVAGALGLVADLWAGDFIWPRFALYVLPSGWAQFFNFGFDWRIIRYALVLTLATGFIFGLLPALEATKSSVSAGLKQESVFLGRRSSRSRLRSMLVVGQIAVSLTFLVGTALMLRRVQTGVTRHYAFDISPILMLEFPSQLHPPGFQRALLDQLASTPGVKSAALGQVWYGRYLDYKTLLVDGKTPDRADGVTQSRVSRNYFETLGISFVRGRNFTEAEAQSEAPLLVVSESFARQFWPSQDPIGHRFKASLTNVDAVVIGIVKDGIREIRSQYEMNPYSGDLYSPLSLTTTNAVEFWLKTEAAPAAMVPVLWKEVQKFDANARFNARPLKGMEEQWVGPMIFIAVAVGVLGVLALTLASIGVYGVMAYTVTQRTREIGIRMALGAQRRAIFGLMLWKGMRLVVWGMLIGLVGSAAISFPLRAFFYGLSPFDPIAFLGVSLFLGAAALLACYLPARRATKADPMAALRYE